MKAGVKRRENDDEYIALTLAPDAQNLRINIVEFAAADGTWRPCITMMI
jgi:hypothetical protein